MIELIGFNIISLAITIFTVLIFGYDLSLKDKIVIIIAEFILMAMLSVGLVMIVGFN